MSAGTTPWSLFDDRWIDGAADLSHADTAPANETRHTEREEKGEEPRERGLTANGALTSLSPGGETQAWFWTAVRPETRDDGASPGGCRPLDPRREEVIGTV